MRFYSPDHMDLIDPSYDVLAERGEVASGDQRRRLYAHEALGRAPYHGVVLARHTTGRAKSDRYTESQAVRLLRQGAHRFLRLDTGAERLDVMGDSGAYGRAFDTQDAGHVQDEAADLAAFYDAVGVNYGLAPDNVVFGFVSGRPTGRRASPSDWVDRSVRTLDLAQTFRRVHGSARRAWEPIGVAQGWSAESYADSVAALQDMGYRYVALGGLARLQDAELLECLGGAGRARRPDTAFHLLGVARPAHAPTFARHGVASFDSSTPMRQATRDDDHNYHTATGGYLAVRLPITSASPRVKRLHRAGRLDPEAARHAEADALDALRRLDRDRASVEEALGVLAAGAALRAEPFPAEAYRALLADRPWKACRCSVCRTVGVEVVLHRDGERNVRRGFHNLHVLAGRLRAQFPDAWPSP